MNKAQWLGMFAFLALGMLFVACRQVPNDTLNGGSGGEHVRYARLVQEARDAFERSPRQVADVELAAARYDEALSIRSDEYATLWLAARASAWLGEYAGDDSVRERHVRRGLTWVNTALKVNPDGIEGQFYHGVLSGLLGDLDNSYGMDAVKQIEERMTGLIERGTDIAHGGPQRVFGVLLLRAPGPPASIGSLRNARKQLEQAVEIAPDWPENQLYLAEWEFAWAKDKDKPEFATRARERLNQHLLGADAKPPDGIGLEWDVWQAKARKLLADHA
ncbi:MAG: hypothetical protein IT464_14530 [Planctomycetes bacterium]|nr:hypothetical protein [Planctomycetota bacterium]